MKRASLPLAALVVAGSVAWLMLDHTQPVSSAGSEATTSSTTHQTRDARSEELDTGGAEAEAELASTGRTKPIVDTEAEADQSAAAYRDRIDDNIAHLEMAAAAARYEGHPQRAELMEMRISGLNRRLAEFEEQQPAALPADDSPG